MKTASDMFYLVISAGTGPIEARRFAVWLAQRLLRTCIDFGLEPIDVGVPVDDDARSISLRFRGERSAVSGLLGTHALVLDSRRDRSGRHRGHRKRWFVQVSASAADPAATKRLDPRDVDLQFSRSGGPGGQHVNTSSTAVRAVHRPTGVAVRVSDSRSQAHNRELALERLAEKLHEREHAAERLAERERHAQQLRVVRGDPIAVWRGMTP